MDLLNPPNDYCARACLNDGRLYQYMRIMYPRWTRYTTEILLLTAAAMAVGAHLNYKFWTTLGNICSMSEKSEFDLCTRMLAQARASYVNVKDSKIGKPFDFESLGYPEKMSSRTSEVIRAQDGGMNVNDSHPAQPWPKDDKDDEDCLDMASWQRTPAMRNDYWDAIEDLGQGLPNHPNHIRLSPRPKAYIESLQIEEQLTTKTSRTSLVDLDKEDEGEAEDYVLGAGTEEDADARTESKPTARLKRRKRRAGRAVSATKPAKKRR